MQNHDHEWHLAIPAIPPLSFRKASRSSSWALESLDHGGALL